MANDTSRECSKCAGPGPFPAKGAVCRDCKSAYRRRYYLQHREAALEAAATHYRENRERISAQRKTRYATRSPEEVAERRVYNRAYYAADRDAHLARSAQWRQANRDRHRATSRRWAAANSDRVRENGKRYRAEASESRREALRRWHVANPERVREARVRRKAASRDAFTLPFTAESLAARLAFYGDRCWMCRGPFEHVDHVKPISRGGPHILANLRPSCAACNLGKKDAWGGPRWTHSLIK